jgi:alpha-galactosidase
MPTTDDTQTGESTDQGSIPEIPDSQDVKIAYVGGGSREWVPKFFPDLALCSEVGGEVALYDLNYEGANRNARFGNWVQERDGAVGDWTYTAAGERSDALADADFVILSTQFNPADTFVHDLDIPKEYGIYHAVGATIGPGGFLRAMRTIPVYREFAASIREHCPDAWVLNYTNPMTFATRALYDEFPDINAIGLCHEVFHAQEHLAELVETYYDVDKPDRDEIDVNVKGVNHFTWVDEAYWNGIDLFEVLDYHLEQDGAAREYTAEELEGVTPFVDNNQVAYELYERFGVFPAAGDRHLVEYAPWFIQGEMPEDLNRWGVKRTGSDFRMKHWNPAESEQTTDVEALMEDDDYTLEESGEIAADLISTLAAGGSMKTHVNLPNRGQMVDVPEGAVVETNALFTQNNVKPITAGPLPRQVRNQIVVHVNNHETTIEAAREGDVDLAFQAFLNDPQVRTLQTETARDLFADLVETERDYLQDWNLSSSEVLAESPEFSG